MQRALTATLGVAALALPAANAVAAAKVNAAAAATPKKTVVTRKVSGSAAQADRWGTVQMNVTMRKTTVLVHGVRRVTRKLVDIGGSFTYHTDRSLYIMQQALPQLRLAALQSKSANVDLISGATYTSEAFVQSLHEALVKANKI
jgi:uncharacterized protein with FMN-binding domain